MRIVTLVLTSSVILASTIAMARPLENDDEIKQALVGNTISGETNGQSYSEFLMPDGRLSGMEPDGAYTGHWHVESGRICFSYDDENHKPGPWVDCARVDVEGSRVTWVDENGDQSVATLTAGNKLTTGNKVRRR
jgi:hypothetical protein